MKREKSISTPIVNDLFNKCETSTRHLLTRSIEECKQNEHTVKQFLQSEHDRVKELKENERIEKEKQGQEARKRENDEKLFGEKCKVISYVECNCVIIILFLVELDPFHELWPLQEMQKNINNDFQMLVNIRWFLIHI